MFKYMYIYTVYAYIHTLLIHATLQSLQLCKKDDPAGQWPEDSLLETPKDAVDFGWHGSSILGKRGSFRSIETQAQPIG